MNSRVDTYKDLIFWQKSYRLARDIIALSRKLPHDLVTTILVRQIIRSSTSIGANIAEGYGRYKGKEYDRFLQIALGSAQETEHWIMLLTDEYPTHKSTGLSLQQDVVEIILMLNKTLHTLRSK